jgi:hypothetical protein
MTLRIFDAALGGLGYVPASRLEEMTKARNAALEKAAALARENEQLQADVIEQTADAAYYRHEYEAEQVAHGQTTQALDEANDMIADLQRRLQPQMRLAVDNTTPRAPGKPLPEDQTILDHTIELAARLISVVFEGRTHWILERDETQFKVPVHDREFLDRVHSGAQIFAAGYVVRGQFHAVSIRRGYDGKVVTRHTLERVLEVIPPPSQTTLESASPATARGAGATP